MNLFLHCIFDLARQLFVAKEKGHRPRQAVMWLFVCVPVICTMYRCEIKFKFESSLSHSVNRANMHHVFLIQTFHGHRCIYGFCHVSLLLWLKKMSLLLYDTTRLQKIFTIIIL